MTPQFKASCRKAKQLTNVNDHTFKTKEERIAGRMSAPADKNMRIRYVCIPDLTSAYTVWRPEIK